MITGVTAKRWQTPQVRRRRRSDRGENRGGARLGPTSDNDSRISDSAHRVVPGTSVSHWENGRASLHCPRGKRQEQGGELLTSELTFAAPRVDQVTSMMLCHEIQKRCTLKEHLQFKNRLTLPRLTPTVTLPTSRGKSNASRPRERETKHQRPKKKKQFHDRWEENKT